MKLINNYTVKFLTFSLLLATASYAGVPCLGGKCIPTRPACFNIFCVYDRKTDGKFHKCEAAAKFTHAVTVNGLEVKDESVSPFNPIFEVKCDDEVFFNGVGRRFTDFIGTRIQTLNTPFPAIVLPRNSLEEGHRFEDSFLELEEQRLEGFCYTYTEHRSEL